MSISTGHTVAPPVSAPIAMPGIASGKLTAGAFYQYAVTYVSVYGETNAPYPMADTHVVTTSAGSVNLTNIPISSDIYVIGRNIYRSTTGHNSNVTTLSYITTIHDNVTTTYVDTTADSDLSAITNPTANTARTIETFNSVIQTTNPILYTVKTGIDTSNALGTLYNAVPLLNEYNFI